MSIVEKLTEGIVRRDLAKEGAALLNKWERTGLLEGLDSDYAKNNMASLLENQAKELLREASLMSAGDVEGFAAVAFPIVRRVFGSLIANDLVSVQPMSLPSGLIFFLDFRFGSEGSNMPRAGFKADESIYGQGVIGSELTGGVDMNNLTEDKQPFGLQAGYTHASGNIGANTANLTNVANGTIGNGTAGATGGADIDKLVRYDPDLASGTIVSVLKVQLSDLDQADVTEEGLRHITIQSGSARPGLLSASLITNSAVNQSQVRRLTRFSGSTKTHALLFFTGSSAISGTAGSASEVTSANAKIQYRAMDDFVSGSGLGSVVGRSFWELEAQTDIPEIEIQVDSVSVTAQTKKLKAKWSPELGQDLNAYHNLDAEVELTSILSEQIALEIDREILADLMGGATAATYYWSRSPGLFVNKETGAELGAASAAPDFTGTVSEWYETLIETINDVSAQIHRKTLRGGANFVVCGPEVANILEFTSGFRANVSHADEKGTIGAVNVGSLSKKFDVMVDPYFPRNVILVGRKGNSFLESGYVYAPYVPLQVTPTIFGTEDFVPRKGVMTRYAKKMVRPDMYGLVVCRGLLGEEGSS
ncbi:MAG: putative major capsid protein [Prokaryotic dsDNA virus sp.]|nr:MAG: putative major capsid protein [Prokaryotic dsDNA virus sp.]|tara:strand:+ start:10185 stop:11957 length:1773 start_codon:yes stop_codon:yes gene_type:complete